jgi:hypothetical protein
MNLHADMERCLSRGMVRGPSDDWCRLVAVLSGRREEGSAVDGVVRLIFEGWVPHDPLFVVVRCLTAGAASS